MNPSPLRTFPWAEAMMDQKQKSRDDLPHRDQKAIEEEAEKSRKALDEKVEPGTDPLHEGP